MKTPAYQLTKEYTKSLTEKKLNLSVNRKDSLKENSLVMIELQKEKKRR
jgi:hypothetical protein